MATQLIAIRSFTNDDYISQFASDHYKNATVLGDDISNNDFQNDQTLEKDAEFEEEDQEYQI
jgi:hypothetical protein